MITCSHHTGAKGFTVIELVMTIVILGVISATALPKFFNYQVYQQQVYFDDTINAIRYAQKLAVVTACNVQVQLSASQFTLSRPANISLCTSTTSSDYSLAVSRPGTGESSYQGTLPAALATPIIFYFVSKGTASANLTITIGSRTIIVVQNTGFVYAP